MVFLTLIFLVCLVLLGAVVFAWKLDRKPVTPTAPVGWAYSGDSLRVIDELTRRLNVKVTDRALEITKAEKRRVVTVADMTKAYEEIIREEHM